MRLLSVLLDTVSSIMGIRRGAGPLPEGGIL